MTSKRLGANRRRAKRASRPTFIRSGERKTIAGRLDESRVGCHEAPEKTQARRSSLARKLKKTRTVARHGGLSFSERRGERRAGRNGLRRAAKSSARGSLEACGRRLSDAALPGIADLVSATAVDDGRGDQAGGDRGQNILPMRSPCGSGWALAVAARRQEAPMSRWPEWGS